jgi:Acetyltransferase (GNAT) domain
MPFMQPIIAPIDKQILLSELNATTFLRHTNKGDNELYIVNNYNAPNTILEIGRLREAAFRLGGGGTGKALDLDEYDTGKHCYQQLIVWNPEEQEIVGGYRYIKCADAIDADGNIHLSTLHYFNFSEQYLKYYLPKTIELGRSFVQPHYQNKDGNRKGLFSLDNLWDGLGALMVLHQKEVQYFFGKMTMYKQFNQIARDHIIGFLYHYFPDADKLVVAKPNLKKNVLHNIDNFLTQLQSLEFKEGHHLLNTIVKGYGEIVPPLINSYMNLSSTMKTFDTAYNPDFGDVDETCILVNMLDIYDSKKDRHVNTFTPKADNK